MDPQNTVPQPAPELVPPPNSVSVPQKPFNWSIVLMGIIVLLLILVGGSFSQVLSLKKQVDKLETAKLEPTPVATPASTGTGTGTIIPAPTNGTNGPIEITGIIKFSNLEGGCWSIVPQQVSCTGNRCPLSDLPNYEIINIPTALKKDGLKAIFKLEVQSDIATICQLGPAVKILDYQIIK